MRMNIRQTIFFFAVLIMATSSTYILTRGYYYPPAVHLSRQLVFEAANTSSTIKAPLERENIKGVITSSLSVIVRENPPMLDFPGIGLDTWIWVCKNGEQRAGQHTGRLYLRRVGDATFQFWDCHESKFHAPDWFALPEQDPGSLDSCSSRTTPYQVGENAPACGRLLLSADHLPGEQ
jgi:hypothetical protein